MLLRLLRYFVRVVTGIHLGNLDRSLKMHSTLQLDTLTQTGGSARAPVPPTSNPCKSAYLPTSTWAINRARGTPGLATCSIPSESLTSSCPLHALLLCSDKRAWTHDLWYALWIINLFMYYHHGAMRAHGPTTCSMFSWSSTLLCITTMGCTIHCGSRSWYHSLSTHCHCISRPIPPSDTTIILGQYHSRLFALASPHQPTPDTSKMLPPQWNPYFSEDRCMHNECIQRNGHKEI